MWSVVLTLTLLLERFASALPVSTAVDLFQEIATTAPDHRFPIIVDHPLQPLGMSKSVISTSTIPTNNFYTNLFLGSRQQPAYLYPYSVWWSQGTNSDYGLAISHTTASQRVFGPNPSANPVEYYYNPVGICSVSFSAAEFDAGMTMSLGSPTAFAVNVTMAPSTSKYGHGRSLYIPLVQGTGFITGIYFNLRPRFNSLVGFQSLTEKTSPRNGIKKYVAKLYDGTSWAIYANVPNGQTFSLSRQSSSSIIASKDVYNVIVQIAKIVDGSESAYDAHAGKYAYHARVYGSAVGSVGTATINYWTLQANNAGNLLLWLLPHHVASMKKGALGFSIDSLSRGKMYAFSTNQIVLQEELPTGIQFEPWTSIPGQKATYTSNALKLITSAAASEIAEDFNAQTNLNSMYYAGKALDKFAMICYVAHSILKNAVMTANCLNKLKQSFALFANNKEIYPLYYDKTYKGIVSSAGILTGSSMADFGATYYNDHHFHYGYHIHTAAVIGYIDTALGGTWVKENKEYVNTLIRDVANPSDADPYFPFSRSFSWFHGHSMAKGLFESADGKDEESSSEDYHHAYAVKLWGQVSGDQSMEARGAMMLAVMRRAMNAYMLMNNTNTIQPQNFIGNKVSGILFENKADHTTYFGTDIQYIQGVHMLPITPASSYIRSPTFVGEEWNSLLSGVAPTLTDGWKGILYANLALYNPKSSYAFFSSSKFSRNYLDPGASLTWYLAYAAGVGGATS
ncbi:endo-1,3(4)-beta-glucanase [Lipomyces kononenkoae]|uniref:Endo-1,3(4)-beta-glucanase n=1 Tax=Lipomyces kononenkoae TaxID=34357 RepID=A0ACC3T284_LIPKO